MKKFVYILIFTFIFTGCNLQTLIPNQEPSFGVSFTRLFTSGYELNTITNGVEWSVYGGTGNSVQSGLKRSGVYAYKALNGTGYTAFQYAASAGSGPYYARVYVYVRTLPSAQIEILTIGTASTPAATGIRMNTTGTLALYNAGGQVGSNSSALSLDTWYRVEYKHDNTGSEAQDALIDGVSFASQTGTAVGSANYVVVGNDNTMTTGELYYDDFAINTGDWAGAGNVVMLLSDATGDNSAWTNDYTKIDENPPVAGTDIIYSSTAGQLEDVNMQSSEFAGIKSTDTVTVVHVGGNFSRSDATYAAVFRFRLKAAASGTVTESANITPPGTAYKTWNTAGDTYYITSYTTPGTANDWTPADLDAMQTGVNLISSSLGSQGRIATMWAMVEGVFTGAIPETTIDDTLIDATHEYGPSPAVVFTSDTTGYAFYNGVAGDINYRKTTDGGNTWGAEATAFAQAGTSAGFGLWYDRWTPGDTTGTKIHFAFVNDSDYDTDYNSFDTASDTIGSDVLVNNATWWDKDSDAEPAIVKASDGDLFLFTPNNVSTNDVWKSVNSGASWSSTSATFIAREDMVQMFPMASGNILLVYYDDSGTALLSRTYTDDGSTNWAASDTTIDADVNQDLSGTISIWGGAMYKSDNTVYVASTNYVNNAAADVKVYKYTGSWATMTDVITNDTTLMGSTSVVDDNTGDVYVIYSRGGTFQLSEQIYYKKSTDGGTTWGTETQLSYTASDHRYVKGNFTSDERLYVVWTNDDLDDLLGRTVVNLTPPSAAAASGLKVIIVN